MAACLIKLYLSAVLNGFEGLLCWSTLVAYDSATVCDKALFLVSTINSNQAFFSHTHWDKVSPR